MKKGEATRLHQIIKKAAVRDAGVVDLGNERTKGKAANLKVRAANLKVRVANAKVRVASGKTKTATQGPDAPNREPNREKLQTGATTKTTASNPVMTGVPNTRGQEGDNPKGRTLKKTQGIPITNAVGTTPTEREIEPRPDAVKVAVAVKGMEAPNHPSQDPGGTTCPCRKKPRVWTLARRNHPRPRQPTTRI
jgi:hypothetical protein